jgi:hypothetical protein
MLQLLSLAFAVLLVITFEAMLGVGGIYGSGDANTIMYGLVAVQAIIGLILIYVVATEESQR